MEEKERLALVEKIQRWHEQDEHQLIIDLLERLPQSQMDYDLTCYLARAYNNLAQPWMDSYQQLLERAVSLLLSVEQQGQQDPVWHYRLGYAYYYLDQEEQALACFQRAFQLDPTDEDVDYFIRQCQQMIRQKEEGPIRYSSQQFELVEQHICRYFGEYAEVLHEKVSPDIHLDVCLIPPREGKNYYTLVTLGMGAHRMNVPEELAEYKLERAELALALPPDWQVGEEDERWYWPIRALKMAARLPIENNTWLGWGHSIDNREPYADNTALCGVMLVGPQTCRDKEAGICRLSEQEEVNFYHLIPLHREEMEFKQTNGSDALLDKLEKVSFIVNPSRPSAVEKPWGDDWIMDSAGPHLDAMRRKHLQVDSLAAYAHMAIYLRWCIQQGLMSQAFLLRFGRVAQQVQEGGEAPDLRLVLRGGAGLNGCLRLEYFNEKGQAFSHWYYWDSGKDHPYYPQDVDGHAWAYFGEEQYHSAQFQDEAYLFVPWNEQYYQAMAARISQRFAQWLWLDGNEKYLEKQLHLPGGQIRPLLENWQGPRGCFATDGIMVRGEKVDFCFREQPMPGDENWDSGWRFFTEAESTADAPRDYGFYDLNTVCNYDPELLPLLDSPYGTSFERRQGGPLQPVSDWGVEAAVEYPYPATLYLNTRLQPAGRRKAEEALSRLMELKGLGQVVEGETLFAPSGEADHSLLRLGLRDDFPETLGELTELINRLGVPKGSQLEAAGIAWPTGRQEGLALSLSGGDLPAPEQLDQQLQDLIEQLEALLDETGRLYGSWKAPQGDVVLYFYGDSYLEMLSAIGKVIDHHPLCQKCTVDRTS